MISQVLKVLVDICDRGLLDKQNHDPPPVTLSQASPATSVTASGFIMNIPIQPLGQVLAWALVLVRHPKEGGREARFQYTDSPFCR